ncbi:MAG: CHAT domain-containing protein [Nannocystis sp.]|nr:CHAT domain-containing protein [Nannocystis sp.]
MVWARHSSRPLDPLLWGGGTTTAAINAGCWEKLGLDLTGDIGEVKLAAGFEDGGCWARIEPSEQTRKIMLRSRGQELWSLPLAPMLSLDPALAQAKALMSSGDFGEALAVLEDVLSDHNSGKTERDLAVLASARDLRQEVNYRSGEFRAALEDADIARTLFRRIGWSSRVCDVTFSLAFRHRDGLQDPEAMGEEIARGATCALVSSRYATDWRYYRAKYFEMIGQLGGAWQQLGGAGVMASRVQDHEFASYVLGFEYALAEAIGEDDAMPLIEAQIEDIVGRYREEQFCGRMAMLTEVSWTRLMARERGLTSEDPQPRLEELFAARSMPAQCNDARNRDNAAINLALSDVQNGNFTRVRALLRDVDAERLGPELALWYHLILVRAAVATEDVKLARRHLPPLRAAAERWTDIRAIWRAEYASGQVARMLGERAGAMRAFSRADALREDILLDLTLGTARARADTVWDRAPQALVELHLTAPAPDLRAALTIVRRTRTRALEVLLARSRMSTAQREAVREDVVATRRAIEESAAKRRSVIEEKLELAHRRELRRALRDRLHEALGQGARHAPGSSLALHEPDHGELMLVYYPIGARWAGFADDGVNIRANVFTLPTDEDGDTQWSAALLDPFADMIARARQLRVIASGEVLAREVHGLPFRGRPLLTQVPVVYALDLPVGSSEEPRVPSRALLVRANPGRTHDMLPLTYVNAEARHVLAAWERAGIEGRELADDQATRERVLAELGQADLFHFVGHGATRKEFRGSKDLWDTELLLGEVSSLSVEDILVAEPFRAPRGVVLSACQTALIEPRARSGGLAIGQSFLLRGSAFVIATSRSIGDQEALFFVKELYERSEGGTKLADPATLAETQASLLDGEGCGERPTVCAYRMWVP